MENIKNQGGRPPYTLNDLWSGWYDDILELYSQGASDVEIRVLIYEKTNKKIKCSYDLWERWLSEEPEFSETIKMGKQISEAWWTKTGRINLDSERFSYTGWYMNMKNRFGWADNIKQDHTTQGEKVGSIDLSKWIE
jgi:hypothetical protein